MADVGIVGGVREEAVVEHPHAGLGGQPGGCRVLREIVQPIVGHVVVRGRPPPSNNAALNNCINLKSSFHQQHHTSVNKQKHNKC